MKVTLYVYHIDKFTCIKKVEFWILNIPAWQLNVIKQNVDHFAREHGKNMCFLNVLILFLQYFYKINQNINVNFVLHS